jgi:hypothetical protein
MAAGLDTRRVRSSTHAELRDYYNQALNDAPVGEITTQLLQAVERGSIAPTAFAPWLGVAKSPSVIREALSQDFSVLIRNFAIKHLRKALWSSRWRETWEEIGGIAGLLDIFADLSVLEVKSACTAIGSCGRGTDLTEKRELFTEFFKALRPDRFPDTTHKTKDRRALERFYDLLIPACSEEVVKQAIASGERGKHLTKYYPECLRNELIRSLNAEHLSTVDISKFKGLLHHYPPVKSTAKGFSKSMDFSLEVLETLSHSERRVVEDRVFMVQLVKPLLRRAIKGHAEWNTIKRIVDLTMRYLEAHASTGRHINDREGDFLYQVAFCWSQQPSLFEQQLRRLCSHPVFGTTSESNIGDWQNLLTHIPARQSYPLLRLLYQASTSLDLDSDGDLAKTKGSLHHSFFLNLSPADALLFFTRLRRVRGDTDLIDRDRSDSNLLLKSNFEGSSASGDPNLFHIWLLNLNNRGEEAKTMATGYIDTRKKKATTASQPEQRAFLAKSALFATIATGSLQELSKTLEWTKRFLRDPLVIREIYPQLYPEEAIRLLSGIPESIDETLSLAELRERVSAANAILQGMFDTVCEALREPSFYLNGWTGVFDLFFKVVKLRIDLTPMVKKQLDASDQEVLTYLWADTIPMLITIEEKAQKDGYEKLQLNHCRGIMARREYPTYELKSYDLSTYTFLDSLACGRDELWCRLRPLNHPATAGLPDPFPRGLPIQLLTAPWILDVEDLSSVAPYVASRARRTVFPDPKTALQLVPTDKDSRQAIGMFVDSYKHALRLYIPRACKKDEKQARIIQAWEYAIGPLSLKRMTADEATRFWSDKNASNFMEWPPKGAMSTIEKQWPLIPDDDGHGEPCEWNPFSSRPNLPSRKLGELTYMDFSVAMSTSSAKVPAYKAERGSIWTESRDIGEGGVLSALLYLDAKYTSDDRLLATPFPSAADTRYPSLYLDDEFLVAPEPNQYSAARGIHGHLDKIPPTLLAQSARNLIKALDKFEASSKRSKKADPHQVAMEIIARLVESDRPGMAIELVVRTVLERPKSSAWHRQLLNRGFLRRLPATQARSCIEAFTGGLVRILQAKDKSKKSSDKRPTATTDEPYAKVTTVKMLVQLCQDLDLIGLDYALSVLSTLSKMDTHIDVRLHIIKSFLLMLGNGSRERSREVLTLLETFVPLAGALDERQPLDEARWLQCEQDLSLPELQPGISDTASSDSPILSALVEYLRQEKTATSMIQPFVDRIMIPVLQNLKDETARWAALFLRKYGFEDMLLGDFSIPSIPRDPSMNRTLLCMESEKLKYIPRTVLEEYVTYTSFRVALPAPMRAMNERLNADPALRTLPEVQTWMRLYGQTLDVTGGAFESFDIIGLLDRATDASDDAPITPKLIQEQFLKLFTTLLWNDTPAYTKLTKGLCRRLLNGNYLGKTWWTPYGKPVLEAMVSYVNTLRTREWERDPARKPSVLPDTFPWRLLLLDYPWPSHHDDDAMREQRCKVFTGQLVAVVNEMSSLPVYHKHLDDITEYLTEVAPSRDRFYDENNLLYNALINNRVLTAIYVGDISKTRLSWLTTPELLRVEIAAALIALTRGDFGKEKAIIKSEIWDRLKGLMETWKACENEEVRRRGWEIDQWGVK